MGYQDVRNDMSKECARNLILRIMDKVNSQILLQYIEMIIHSDITEHNLQVSEFSSARMYMWIKSPKMRNALHSGVKWFSYLESPLRLGSSKAGKLGGQKARKLDAGKQKVNLHTQRIKKLIYHESTKS
jgi:hypothetical protein